MTEAQILYAAKLTQNEPNEMKRLLDSIAKLWGRRVGILGNLGRRFLPTVAVVVRSPLLAPAC